MCPRAGLDGCGKSPPTGIRSPDRPARSESLYRHNSLSRTITHTHTHTHTYIYRRCTVFYLRFRKLVVGGGVFDVAVHYNFSHLKLWEMAPG